MNPFSTPRLLRSEYDLTLLWTVLALLALGVVMVYSASIATAEADRHVGYRSSYYFVRQLLFVGLSLGAGFVVFQLVSVSAIFSSLPFFGSTFQVYSDA